MGYRNVNNLQKLWKDNPKHTNSRNKRRYYKVPNPGRAYEHSISLQVLLKINHLEHRDVYVNGRLVKEKAYPVSYMDYVHVNGKSYYVNVVNQGKKHKIRLVPKDDDFYYYPIKRWYLYRGHIRVNTFQNKNFDFTPDKHTYSLIKSYTTVIENGRLIDALASNLFHLSKITGKDKYVNYKVLNWVRDNTFIHLTLESQHIKHVKVHHLDFNKRYVWKLIDGVKPLDLKS